MEPPARSSSPQVFERILVVEDSPTFASALQGALERELGCQVTRCPNLWETRQVLARGGPFDVAVCDLVLPDGPDGQAVSLLREHGVPTVAYTASLAEGMREAMWRLGVID